MNSGVASKSTVDSKIDFGPEARMLLEAIDDVFRGRSGFMAPINFLRGSVDFCVVVSSFELVF